MKILVIITPNNDIYKVNEKGEIMTKKSGSFSPTWLFRGLSSVKSNEFISFKDLTPERIKSIQLLYKNGNPRYTGADLDHGTRREWGNTTLHGIKAIGYQTT